ncbi:MAG TPA: putative Ig domain-containing protein, partial [Lacipirellulaceae bacterium]
MPPRQSNTILIACFLAGLSACALAKPFLAHPHSVVLAGQSIPEAGTTIDLAYNRAVAGTEETGWTIAASGGAVTVTSGTGSGTSAWTLTLSRTIQAGESVTIAYAPGDIKSTQGNRPLAAFSARSVTNSSTQGSPATSPEPLIAASSTLVIADEGTIDFTPTLLNGTSVTYSAVNLPPGASINASTGQITGTLSTPGRYMVKITAANAEGTDYITKPIIVYSMLTTIDAAWLAARTPPYMLT